MCGFAGVIAWDEKYRVTRDTLEKMSRAIAHRGPDGEGYHLTRENEPITPDTPQVGLAFRRLAILDPDPRSNQPFHIGPLTLVYNGEIYNFRDLKSEISRLRPDYAWRTTGDTEVLLMAYEVWREKCVEKLNGMFAFAVWDEQKKELFLARDRMGQKPVCHSAVFGDGAKMGSIGGVAFSSELSGLRAVPWYEQRVDSGSIIDYLQFGFLFWNSVYSDTKHLHPGSTIVIRVKTSEASQRTYFRHSIRGPREKEWAHLTHEQRVAETRSLVQQAVSKQLVSDVPVGCFLSGGIDSSIVASCMRQEARQAMTFSIGLDDERYNEASYAKEVARHLNTTHHQFTVKPNAVEDLPKLAAVYGEPFGDSSALPTHYLSREVRGFAKVALSGDGGDELFGGYDRYRAMALARHIDSIPRSIRLGIIKPAMGGILNLLGKPHPKSRRTQFKRFTNTIHLSPSFRYESYLRIFDDAQINQLYASGIVSMTSKYGAGMQYQSFSGNRDAVAAALAADRSFYLPGDLLTKVDRASMLHGLEVRSPFMDHDVVRFASTLTASELLKGGPKRMLREAFAKDLPDFVFKRKKMGFAVPIGEWFRGELKPMLRDNLFASDSFGKSHFNMKVVERLVDEHQQQRIDHSQRLYALLMLELWWQQQRR